MNRLRTLAVLAMFSLPPAYAVLLTPSEAQQQGDRACTPLDNGMLDCVDIAPPAPGPSNDPSIEALPPIEYPGEQFPPPTTEAPIKPSLDPIPEKLPGNRLIIGWDIGFGTTAQYWEVWDNGELRMRSRNFTSRRLADGSVEGAERVNEQQIVSVQSGVYTLDNLAEGRHDIEIRLCNVDRDGKPQCTPLTASTWVGPQGGSTDEDDDLPTGQPSAPQLDWLPQVNTGEPVELAWNVWWGKPGRYWQVLDGDRVLYESTSFREVTPNSQSAGMTLAGLPKGVHELSVKLCNQLQCARSDKVRLEVLLPPAGDVKPLVTVSRGTPDSVLLAWSLPQAQADGRPDGWRLLDAASDDPLAEPLGNLRSDVRVCQKTDPAAPGVSVASYCGDLRLPQQVATTYGSSTSNVRVSVCRKDECVASDTVSLLPGQAHIEPVPAPAAPRTTGNTRPTTVAAPVVEPDDTPAPAPTPTPTPAPAPRGRFVLPDEVLDSLLDERELSTPTPSRR
ncbi:chitinase N-terminal domain-containing protein [Chitiniphilus shinanonensis]|uniref:chitinase N-terminal domain-containing protein n=1 Tax=Chitiniphilus shinanonensis TaxID=553088 RepID=UPI00304DA57D